MLCAIDLRDLTFGERLRRRVLASVRGARCHREHADEPGAHEC
jgi:hypothetical protein